MKARFLRQIAATLVPFSALLTASPAAAEWREASTDHFLIYADASEKWTRAFAERLEHAASTMEQLQPGIDRSGNKSNRVVIYAVSGTSMVEKLCGKCGSVAGFYVPRVGHSIAYSARTSASEAWDMTSDIVLLHEYAHHFMLSTSNAAFPKWYSEGLAEFFSTIQVARDGTVEVGRIAKHRAYNLINATMKIEDLIDSVGRKDDLAQDIFYGRAWLLTHMLMFDPARKGQTTRYLTGLNSGKPNLVAAREAFGDLSKLNKDLKAYASKALSFVRMPVEKSKIGSVTLRPLTPGEAAMMPVRLWSDRGVSQQQALALVPDARRRSAPFATDPATQAFLAEVEYDAGNDVEAEAAADRALAVDPKSVEALLYKGRVRIRRAATARSTDAKVWKEARSWYVKANGVDPDAAEPLFLFYLSFAQAGVKPTANAALGLARAFELSPQDPALRMTAVFQYLTDGNIAAARNALLALAYAPHVPAEHNFAARLVAMIDAKTPVAEILGQMPKAEEIEGGAEP